MLTEQMLQSTSVPVAFLRAAWFMENAAWDVESARAGVIRSFLQPLDHAIPMVATADIAQVTAELLNETWSGARIVELEGPQRYSANDIAAGFSLALGRDVAMPAELIGDTSHAMGAPSAGWKGWKSVIHTKSTESAAIAFS